MKVKVAQLCLTLYDSMDYTVHGILQARILEWVAFPFSRGSPKPGIKPRSPALQADSLPPEPPEKPKNTGMGSLSFLQQIFLTQGNKTGSPTLQADSLPAEPQGKPIQCGKERHNALSYISCQCSFTVWTSLHGPMMASIQVFQRWEKTEGFTDEICALVASG